MVACGPFEPHPTMTRFGRVLPEHSVRPRHPAERTSRPDAPSRDQSLKFIQDAVAGQEWAWRELYRRYNPLIVSVARPYRLSTEAVDDVSQNVWGLLFTHLEGIREPLALPGWIVTTTRNEALRVQRRDRRTTPVDPQADPRLERVDRSDPGENLLKTEQLRELEALLHGLQTGQRRLVRLLLADPQPSYAQISRELGMPIGSIGPTRARCLAQLRKSARRRSAVMADAA